MILTLEEFAVCAQYESKLKSAQRNVMHTLGRAGVQALKTIYTRVTNRPAPKADSCGSCELRLQKQIGAWYFADKADYERKAEGKAVKAAEAVAEKADNRNKTKE